MRIFIMIASAGIFLISCAPLNEEVGQKHSVETLPPDWQYVVVQDVSEISLPLPSDIYFGNLKDSTLVEYKYYDNKDAEIGFAFEVADDDGDFPPGIVFDTACDKNSEYIIEDEKELNGYQLKKIRTTCGNLVKFLIESKPLLIRIHPADQSERLLKIVENIVSNAKINVVTSEP